MANPRSEDKEATKEVEAVNPFAAQIEEAWASSELAIEQGKKTREARAEAVTYWDSVYDTLARLKGRVEHVQDSPIRDSKLWGVLMDVETIHPEDGSE